MSTGGLDPNMLNAFQTLNKQARDDERRSIEHYNKLLNVVTHITPLTVDEVMPNLIMLITKYGSIELLHQRAPDALTACQTYLHKLLNPYLRRLDKKRDMLKDNNADREVIQDIEHRENVVIGLIGQWVSNFLMPLIQTANIEYKPTDAGLSEASFGQMVDRVQEYQQNVKPEQDPTVSQSDISSQNY